MQVYTDLHLHSCLSPCADDDMTPWNIVGMASLKGLDVIAFTDHNAAHNLPEAMAAGRALGVEILPGLEVTTREEVHVLAYFCTLEDALAFGELVYAHLPDVKNHPALFGHQLLIGKDDKEQGELSKLLISATDFSVEALVALIEEYRGIAVPAHINRGSNGIIGALGMISPLPFSPVVEVYRGLLCPEYATAGRFVLHSSDAHQLADIFEREFFIEAEEKTAAAVWKALREEALARG